MAEEEVKYASVDIKTKKQPQSEAKHEKETVYDEVKVNKEPDQAKTVEDAEYAEVQKQTKRFQQTPDTTAKAADDAEYAEVQKQNERFQQTPNTTGPLSDKAAEKCRRYQQLACCFGILCVLLVLSIIGVCVYQNKITTLTAENQELRSERENLTTMEKTWNEQNVSRAQWSIDEYCPKGNNGRSCTSCQKGWSNKFSSCYAYNDAQPSEQRNWEEAREDCRTKNSDLTAVLDQAEKDYVNEISPVNDKIKGYWIGLRAEGGKWSWIDGSDLTNQAWIQQQPAGDGQCVTSLQGREWRSVSCDEKNAWICEKKALSV
ncbi:killer cell lectin-like receptor subfamily B member 1B allele A [Fundulus diaphanus]